MNSREYQYNIPFPALPESIRSRYSIGELALRPFGRAENDLAIDFRSLSRPDLVTRILICCSRNTDNLSIDELFPWDLTIGKRIECLLAIATENGRSVLPFQLQCLNQKCRERMEIEIKFEDMSKLQARADKADPLNISVDGNDFAFRLPTGTDQRRWLAAEYPGEKDAFRHMVQTLMLTNPMDRQLKGDDISDEMINMLNNALDDWDLLTSFSISVKCPACGRDNRYFVDLEEELVKVLRKIQGRLLNDIHRLAAFYNWTEDEVLAVPPWRRSHYLSLIENEVNR